MRHPFNYLSLLSLPALAALIYFPTGDADFLGFLGFLVFLRYLWVNPDELFLLTLRRAATSAFLAEPVPEAELPDLGAQAHAQSLLSFHSSQVWNRQKKIRERAKLRPRAWGMGLEPGSRR